MFNWKSTIQKNMIEGVISWNEKGNSINDKRTTSPQVVEASGKDFLLISVKGVRNMTH